MQSNPVRDAIEYQSKGRLGASQILMQELENLETFQPRDSNIKIRNGSSFDYFVKTQYRPQENMDHTYQLTALAFIMSTDNRTCPAVLESENFEVLLTDIVYRLEKVARIDPRFLRLLSSFT